MTANGISKLLGSTRVMGGWIQSVTGLNKGEKSSKSIVGAYNITGDLPSGLYLDCDVTCTKERLSWRYKRNYTLFKITSESGFEIIQIVENIEDRLSDWATQFWSNIEKALREEVTLRFKNFTDKEIWSEAKRRGLLNDSKLYNSIDENIRDPRKNSRAIRLE